MWKNLVQPARPQMTLRRMPITCWIPTATSTHSEYVILFDFPLQKCFRNAPHYYIFTYIAVFLILWFKSETSDRNMGLLVI